MKDNSELHFHGFYDYLSLEKRYSEHTLKSYRNDLQACRRYVVDEYNIAQWSNCKLFMLRSWLVQMVENNLSAKSIHRKLSSVRSLFRYLLRKGIIEKNITSGLVAPKIAKRLPDYVPHKDMKVALEVHTSTDYKSTLDKLIVNILYNTGMRRDELLNLKLSNTDFSEAAFKVKGKGNKDRIIPAPRVLFDDIQLYLDIRKFEIDDDSSDFLLVSSKGKPLYPKYIYNVIHKFIQRSSTIEKKNPHTLRHSYATHLLNNGADINAIKELLGHSSLAATQVYTHNSIEKLKEIYSKSHPRR